jgi:hypothetical protein
MGEGGEGGGDSKTVILDFECLMPNGANQPASPRAALVKNSGLNIKH